MEEPKTVDNLFDAFQRDYNTLIGISGSSYEKYKIYDDIYGIQWDDDEDENHQKFEPEDIKDETHMIGLDDLLNDLFNNV